MIKHEFYNVEPTWDVSNKSDYLYEDLFQALHKESGLTIDLGWYDLPHTFILYVIKNENWEQPVVEFKSVSAALVYANLLEVMEKIVTSELC